MLTVESAFEGTRYDPTVTQITMLKLLSTPYRSVPFLECYSYIQYIYISVLNLLMHPGSALGSLISDMLCHFSCVCLRVRRSTTHCILIH